MDAGQATISTTRACEQLQQQPPAASPPHLLVCPFIHELEAQADVAADLLHGAALGEGVPGAGEAEGYHLSWAVRKGHDAPALACSSMVRMALDGCCLAAASAAARCCFWGVVWCRLHHIHETSCLMYCIKFGCVMQAAVLMLWCREAAQVQQPPRSLG